MSAAQTPVHKSCWKKSFENKFYFCFLNYMFSSVISSSFFIPFGKAKYYNETKDNFLVTLNLSFLLSCNHSCFLIGSEISLWPCLSVRWFVSRSFCHNFQNGLKVSLPCSFQIPFFYSILGFLLSIPFLNAFIRISYIRKWVNIA